MTNKEKFEALKKESGVTYIKPTWNLKSIADHFGGVVKRRQSDDPIINAIPDEYAIVSTHWIDFGENSPSAEEIEEFLYGETLKALQAVKDGIPSIFYDSHDPVSRLKSLARVLDQAGRDGETKISLTDPELAARDIDWVLSQIGERVHYDEEISFF